MEDITLLMDYIDKNTIFNVVGFSETKKQINLILRRK